MTEDDFKAALLSADAGPDAGEIEAAPILRDWRFVWLGEGELFRVQLLGWQGQDSIQTSPVLALEVDPRGNGWVRTCSRFYRLHGYARSNAEELDAARKLIDLDRALWVERYGLESYSPQICGE